MRQDRRFTRGEAVTSREIARLLSGSFDWLITVDPHLHRYGSLSELYQIPTRVMHAAPLISQWIRENVRDGLIIGRDSESEQWVSSVAADAGLPYSVLQKTRHGDRNVEITIRDARVIDGKAPVFVDDIISTGRTMIEAIRSVGTVASLTPVCVAVHGIFADNSDAVLASAGARVVTSNSIAHATNAIDIGPLLVPAIRKLIS
jgi:ribose-phosphate pyrophosphokinase